MIPLPAPEPSTIPHIDSPCIFVEILTTEGITVFMTSFLLIVVLEIAFAEGA